MPFKQTPLSKRMQFKKKDHGWYEDNKNLARLERKKKEYNMAVVRTMGNVFMMIVGLVSFVFTALIYHKVYWR